MSERLLRCKEGQGLFIAIEGLDGAGKTTYAKYLHEYLTQSMHYDVVLTSEPGGTDYARESRKLLFAEPTKNVAHSTQALLVNSARRDHVDNLIRPSLRMGKMVICDRYTLSTRMYQYYAENLDIILALGTMGVHPHVTLAFDVPYEISIERIKKQAEVSGRDLNWLDLPAPAEFNKRRDVLLRYALDNPLSVILIDASKTKDEMNSAVNRIMSNTLLPLIAQRLVVGEH